MARGETVQFEDQLFRIIRNGRMEDAYFTLCYSPIHSEAGQVAGTLVVLVETTQRKRAEKELEATLKDLEKRVEERTAQLHAEVIKRNRIEDELLKNQRLLRDIIDSSPSAIFLKDRDGKFITSNTQLEKMLGVTQEELAGKTDYDIASKDVADCWRSHDEQVMKTGQSIQIEEVADLKDGHHVFLANKFPLVDPSGQIYGVCAISHDITERKRGEEAARQAGEEIANRAAELEAIYEAQNDAILMYDTDMNVRRVNPSFNESYGFNPVGLNVKEIVRRVSCRWEDGRPFIWEEQPTPRALRGDRVTGARFIVTKADGVELAVETSSGPMRVGGRVIGSVTVWHDITERRRAEEALREAHGELEIRVEERTAELSQAYEALQREMDERQKAESQLRQAQKMEALGTLSGGIAHDFNNILAAIIGFSELLEGHTAKGSRDAHHLHRIMEAGIRGRELVRQMLTFSRKTEQEKKPLPVSSIVKETVKLLRATTPSTISVRVNALSEASILGDPTQIQQVLMNLCANATYAMREKGGSLDIELSEMSVSPSNGDPQGIAPGQYVKLVVRDTGTGMSPDIMDKIFDPFFTTKKLGEGTGLGLSVVHGIVKQHEGSITVESEPGRGSTFTVYFPQIFGDLETDAVTDDEIPTGSERILFVDDEEALVEMGEDILAELGYEVTARMNGREAVALLKEDPSRFDLVITDQTMPEMTGIELAGEVLATRADMPIIMCTGFSHVVDADKARAAGVKAFALKPLTKREIARTVRHVLDE
jgi:PAS domain S-box-containing protein